MLRVKSLYILNYETEMNLRRIEVHNVLAINLNGLVMQTYPSISFIKATVSPDKDHNIVMSDMN